MQQGKMVFLGHSYLQLILHVSIISRVVLPVSGLVLGGDLSCDSTIVNSCPSNCLLLDARSGCIFCKPDCQSASHQVHTQPSGSQGSGTGHISGSGSQPWTCDLDVMTSCPTECITLEQITGCVICRKDCAHTDGSNLPTSAPSIGYHVETKTTQAPSTGCPQFPSNCPHNYINFENGCLVCTKKIHFYSPSSTKKKNLHECVITCTALTEQSVKDRLAIINQPCREICTLILHQVNVQPTVITTTTPAPVTCMPIRCVSPCNVGVIIMSDGCPACKCPDHV